MKRINHNQLLLDSEERKLLFFQISNEVLNGFQVSDFEREIGSSKEGLKTMFQTLRSIPCENDVIIELEQAPIIRNALSLSLEELGTDEFQTRIGFDFEWAQGILEEFNLLIPAAR